MNLPHDLDAEKALLGSIIQRADVLDTIADKIKAEYFFDKNNALIYKTIFRLYEEEKQINLISVQDELKKRKKLKAVGGSFYLTELTENAFAPSNAKNHASVVWEKHLLRELILLGDNIQKTASDESYNPQTILQRAEEIIFNFSQTYSHGEFEEIGNVLGSVIDSIEAIRAGGQAGVETGFDSFDKITNGFSPTDLVILAARPGMGKTAFVLNIARNSAVPAAIFSLEMSKKQLSQRVLLAESNVDSHKVRGGYVSDQEIKTIVSTAGKVADMPIYIDDTPDITLYEMRSKARQLKAAHKIELVIIDYLQLMSISGRQESRNQELAKITRNLKQMAKELDLPIIVLSQLSRQCEHRSPAKPILSDLRDSGAIEQDADMVVFIYREAYYQKMRGEEPDDMTAEINIAKNRNGLTGTAKLTFLDHLTKFENQSIDF